MDAGGGKFLLEVYDQSGRALDAAEIDELRRGLADNGAIDAQPSPSARFADPVTLLTVTVGVVQAAAAMTEILSFLRAWRERKNGEGVRHMRVRVGGAELPAKAGPETYALASALLRPADAQGPRRYALIVAVDSYEDPALSQLRSPGVDAQALANVLADGTIGGYQVEVIRNGDERSIRRRVAEFLANRDPEDLILMHFSCHGVKDGQNRLHLAATDTEVRTLGATAIAASFLDSQMAQTRARYVVLILDCCFSGAYARDMSARADRSVNIDEEFGHSGRVVLTASSATEYAFEGATAAPTDAIQPSVFTSALVDGLRTGQADLDGDGEVSVDEWYTYAFREVTARGVGQVPTKSSSAMSGAFFIARSPQGAQLPDHLLEDLRHDRVPLRLAAIERLRRLAQQAGGIAVTARRELQRLQAEDDSTQVRAAAAQALADISPPPAPAPPPPATPPPRTAPRLAPAPPAPKTVILPPSQPTAAPLARPSFLPTGPVPPSAVPAPVPTVVSGPPLSPAPLAVQGPQPFAPPLRARTPTNQLAVAAFAVSVAGLILTILGIGILIAPAGAILGHKAKQQCTRRGQPGRPLAIAAIVIGWTGLGLGAVLIAGVSQF